MNRFPRTEKRVVINIRGTNGSGKTTVMKQMINMFGNTPLLRKEKVWAYQCHFEPRYFVLGRYEKELDGCDTIPTLGHVSEGVARLSEKGNVLFEGILVSIVTKPWVELAESLPGCRFVFATLDTPSELCVERVRERRRKMGESGSWNPKNLLVKHEAVMHAHSLLKDAGMDVRWLSHKYPTQQLINWMLEERYGKKR